MMRTSARLTLCVVVLAAFCLSGAAYAGETYNLGLSLAITGPTSDAGNPYSKGVEDYIKFVNETKLLGDDQVNCPIKDDQYQTANTKRYFEEFLDEEIVLFLSYATGANQALAKDYTEEQIPVIPASFDKSLISEGTGSPFIFLSIPSYSHQFVGLGEYVAKNHQGEGTPKVALFVHPSAFGRAPVEDLKSALSAGLKLEVVEVVEHGTDLDNSALLQRLQNKGVQYVLSQTVQSPVATLLKDAQRLGVTAQSFGEAGKLTFLGAHYTGGADLIALAGDAAEGFFWTTGYRLTSVDGPWVQWQLDFAKKYGRDEKTANSHNYANGIMAAQVAVEAIRRVKESGNEISRANLVAELNSMNGDKAFETMTTVGPVSYSETDRMGVDHLQMYVVQDGVFKAAGEPFQPEFLK